MNNAMEVENFTKEVPLENGLKGCERIWSAEMVQKEDIQV
jgi:hypothetical protein